MALRRGDNSSNLARSCDSNQSIDETSFIITPLVISFLTLIYAIGAVYRTRFQLQYDKYLCSGCDRNKMNIFQNKAYDFMIFL